MRSEGPCRGRGGQPGTRRIPLRTRFRPALRGWIPHPCGQKRKGERPGDHHFPTEKEGPAPTRFPSGRRSRPQPVRQWQADRSRLPERTHRPRPPIPEKGSQHPRTGLPGRRPLPQPQRGIPLHPFRPRPGADRLPLLRPAGPQRALFPDPGPSRRMGGRRQRRRTGQGQHRRTDAPPFQGNPTLEHLSLRLHRREMAQGDPPAREGSRERLFPRNGSGQDRPAR